MKKLPAHCPSYRKPGISLPIFFVVSSHKNLVQVCLSKNHEPNEVFPILYRLIHLQPQTGTAIRVSINPLLPFLLQCSCYLISPLCPGVNLSEFFFHTAAHEEIQSTYKSVRNDNSPEREKGRIDHDRERSVKEHIRQA